MRKYWHVLNIGLQNTLVYRLNFLFRATFGLIPLTATIFVWRAIYEGKPGGKVATYELAQMISYYLVITIVDALTAVTEDDWQIAADIKDGNISQFLLKPMDYLTYRLCLFGAGRMVFAAVALVPTCGFIWLLRDHFVLPSDPAAAAWFGSFTSPTIITPRGGSVIVLGAGDSADWTIGDDNCGVHATSCCSGMSGKSN